MYENNERDRKQYNKLRDHATALKNHISDRNDDPEATRTLAAVNWAIFKIFKLEEKLNGAK